MSTVWGILAEAGNRFSYKFALADVIAQTRFGERLQ
jgi:hypothetical protein